MATNTLTMYNSITITECAYGAVTSDIQNIRYIRLCLHSIQIQLQNTDIRASGTISRDVATENAGKQ